MNQALPSAISDAYGGYLLLNLLDLAITSVVLLCGGNEANPFGLFLLSYYGIEAFIIGKMSLVALTLLACEALRRRNPMASYGVIGLGLAVYFALLMWESSLLFEHHQLIVTQLQRVFIG